MTIRPRPRTPAAHVRLGLWRSRVIPPGLLTWRRLVELAVHVLIWAAVGFVLVLAVIGSVHPTADNRNYQPAPPSATPPPPPTLPDRSTP